MKCDIGKVHKSVLAILVLVLATFAADAQAAEEGEGFDCHATTFSYFFQDGDMDFHFGNLVLGATGNGGAEIGEAFFAASQIQDGDAEEWRREWFELAQRVEARGEKSLAAGHKVSARQQLLRAANYYRFSII
ncbi:MAG: alpha/beta hydrolase, partial [Desulfovibrionaceae bacterium]